MVSVGCFVFLSVLLCCLQAATPQMYSPRRNVKAMYPMDSMGMMNDYSMTYPARPPRLSAEERATIFVNLFECGVPGMPRCDVRYASSLVRLFRNIANNIESKMPLQSQMQMGAYLPSMMSLQGGARSDGTDSHSRTMPESFSSRSGTDDKDEKLKKWGKLAPMWGR